MSERPSEKVIISCALTGAVTAKQLCPAIPRREVASVAEARALLWPNAGGNF